MTITASRPLPPLAEPRPFVLPEVAEHTLPNGLRIMAVPRTSVPLVEVRLRVPFGGDVTDVPAATLLAETLMSGTGTLSNIELAAALQTLGADLGVSVDTDRMVVSGNTLATGLRQFLGLMSDVVLDAVFPEPQVAVERENLADRIEVALSRPGTLARRALLTRLFGTHPYGRELPDPDEVQRVSVGELRALRDRRVLPAGSVLIVVGAVEPSEAFALAESAFASWEAPGENVSVVPPAPFEPGPVVLVDRPGSVQSALRMALPGVRRADADYPAFQLANLIFGGYFSSRLVTNIREDKGYTYSAHSSLDHSVATSVLLVEADVASEVTAPALHEIWYELGRIATVAPTADELADVRQYAIGTQSLSIETQAGLANMLATLSGAGLPPAWLSEHLSRLSEVTLDEVAAAATRHLAPSRAVSVVLGDAAAIRDQLETLAAVSVTAA